MGKLSEQARLEVARQRVITAFENHWRRNLRSRKKMVKERADCFFAGSTSDRERMAERFYGRDHVQQMASLNDTEICETLEPWLKHALRYWLDRYDDDDGDDFLDELSTSEYVCIVHSHCLVDFLIDRYPNDRAGYDDLYERMLAGISRGGVVRVYKSTGERFTPSEVRSVRAGIRCDLLTGIAEAGDDDPWVINTVPDWGYGTEGFDDEDFERVVIVEVNDYGDGEDMN